MAVAWPLMPEWVEVAPEPVHRGDRVRVGWAAPPGDGHVLHLALVVHHDDDTVAWVVHARGAVSRAPGSAQLQVPAGAPYSYPGALLAFHWGVALAHAAGPADRPLGWSAVRVLP